MVLPKMRIGGAGAASKRRRSGAGAGSAGAGSGGADTPVPKAASPPPKAAASSSASAPDTSPEQPVGGVNAEYVLRGGSRQRVMCTPACLTICQHFNRADVDSMPLCDAMG